MILPQKQVFRLLALALGLWLALAAPAYADLFGKKESYSTDLRPFPKWTEVIERFQREKNQTSGNCRTEDTDRCQYKGWDAFIESLRGKDKQLQLNMVNSHFNKSRYIQDINNWGKSDYWATPGQFLTKSGDCEDYSIIKYYTLKQLGWPVEDMRIVVLQDMNLKIMHAILAVKLNGVEMILDNQLSIVTNADRIRHYRPVYAINEQGWWRFQ